MMFLADYRSLWQCMGTHGSRHLTCARENLFGILVPYLTETNGTISNLMVPYLEFNSEKLNCNFSIVSKQPHEIINY